jgi:hypothetical protein
MNVGMPLPMRLIGPGGKLRAILRPQRANRCYVANAINEGYFNQLIYFWLYATVCRSRDV